MRNWWKYCWIPGFRKWAEKGCIWVAWHMVPRKIVYWCGIRMMAEASTGEYSKQVVPEMTAMDVLKRWK